MMILISGAYVGLAAIGEVGSWQRECKVTFKLRTSLYHLNKE